MNKMYDDLTGMILIECINKKHKNISLNHLVHKLILKEWINYKLFLKVKL